MKLAWVLGTWVACVGVATAGNVDLPRFPAISPDGERITFAWRGDLWVCGVEGGQAARLSGHPLSEARSAWSPDGGWVVFEANRDGALNLYAVRPDGTELRQLTFGDRGSVLSEVTSSEVLVHARREGDVYRAARPYGVPLEGGTPRRLHDAFGESPARSPDGSRLAFVRGGSSWSRRGYRGSDARELWVYDLRLGVFTQLTEWEGNDGRPRWVDDDTLLFLSDRDGAAVNVYRASVEEGAAGPALGEVRALTEFTDDVHGLDVSRDGSTAVLTCWDGLYVLDLEERAPVARRLDLTAPEDDRDRVALVDVSREVSEAAYHPSGEAVAVVARGEVFVRGTGDEAPTRRVTSGVAREQGVAWSPDGEVLYFVSDRDGTESIYTARVVATRAEVERERDQLLGLEVPEAEEVSAGARWADAWRVEVAPWVASATQDRDPSPSPDGVWVAFRRGRGSLVLRSVATGVERVVYAGWDAELEWRWRGDGKYLAYAVQDRDFNADVWVVPVDGAEEPVNVSMHPDYDFSPRWSADGKVLVFLSERGGDVDVWRVYLDARLEASGEEGLRAYHEAAAAAASEPEVAERLDLEGAYLRVAQLTTWRGDERDLELTPGGDQVVVTAEGEDGRGLYRVRWDGRERTRLGGAGSVQGLSGDGRRVLVVRGGRAEGVPVSGGSAQRLGIEAELRVDLEAQAQQVFEEVARILGERFYHPTMKGLDWEALTARYGELIGRARTPGEFSWVANRLLGELNASHLGVYPRGESSALAEPVGRLGAVLRPEGAGYRVASVVSGGPSDQGPRGLRVGDRVVAVGGVRVGGATTLEQELRGTVGREVEVGVERVVRGVTREVPLLLTPVSYGEVVTLRYEAWCRRNAAEVHARSGGRLGYLHIRSMNAPSLVHFERDLYAAAYGREGLVLDVRNNGGGWTADRVLASLTQQPHAYTVPRGADPTMTDGYPQGRLFIQRYTLPANMLCNEKSFSNAEILSHAFRTLGRGTLVGETTYGGVISTGGTSLLDGTFVRIPFRGWFLPDGTDMENHGAEPDLRVAQTPRDEVAQVDRQLQAAVDELLERLQ